MQAGGDNLKAEGEADPMEMVNTKIKYQVTFL